MNEEEIKTNGNIISLAEASKLTGYHQDYLGFLCRTGKLRGFKVGRNWVTTKEAVETLKRGIKDEASALPENLSKVGSEPNSTISSIPVVVKDNYLADSPGLSLSAKTSEAELDELKENVILGIGDKVESLHSEISLIEERVAATESKLKKSSSEAKTILPVIAPAGIMGNKLGNEANIKNQFASNFQLTQTGSQAVVPEVLSQGTKSSLSSFQDFRSSFSSSSFGGWKLDGIVFGISALGFLASLGLNMLNRSTSPDPGLTKIVYEKTTATDFLVPTSTQATTTEIVIRERVSTETIVKSLSADSNLINRLIDQRLNQYLAEGKFKGEKGDTGSQGAPGADGVAQTLQGGWTTGYVPPSQPGGGGAGTIGSFTYFSTDKLTVIDATVNNSLTVPGTSVFSGNATFNGTTTISNLTVSSLNLGLTQGSVVFQGASGLAEDSSNFYWNDSLNALSIGTTTIATSAIVQIESTDKGFLSPRM
ncbi:MAG TPA: hypothetical protein VIK81_01470, partial [Patescibacteria group bacterium]